MDIDVEKLSLEELVDLNKRVVHRIRYLYSLKTRSQLDRFEVGDHVTFQGDGKTIAGVVVRPPLHRWGTVRQCSSGGRVNQKTLSVLTDCRHHWKIHPKFLTKVHASIQQLPADIRSLMDGQNQ